MDDADRIERLVEEHAGPGWLWQNDPVWLTVFPERVKLPEHGWKLHVSSRAATFLELARDLLPVLRAEGCAFKLARSSQVLEGLNDGVTSPATVGKAFTVYPDQRRFRELGLRLSALLRGRQGPRVLSDRRIVPDAPVYYRYGPFTRAWRSDARGQMVTRLHGPDGEEFDALATLRYRQPSWVTDPFTGTPAGGVPAEPELILGDHYLVVDGIYESARGNVYRAIDQRDGKRVVIKQARALVDERAAVGDIRLRLRNERRVLQVLDGLSGVPRFVDHFRCGKDEFLVTTDCGPCNLAEEISRNGRYIIAGKGAGARTLDRLARQLARIVISLHERRVLIRDLAPKNIVVDGLDITVIDFGLAWHDDVYIPGGTLGYAPTRQLQNAPPRETDDLHALGMTLLCALLGTTPVTLGKDPELPRLRALQALRSSYGNAPGGIVGAIADLLSDDSGHARNAIRRLASGTMLYGFRASAPLPLIPAFSPELAGEITCNVRADLLSQTETLLDLAGNSPTAHDASIYSGSAGIGLELLQHADLPAVSKCLQDLVGFTSQAISRAGLPPGLFVGSTGTALFLQAARDHGIDVASGDVAASIPSAGWTPAGDDLIVGSSGVGLGHLLLYRASGDPAHMEVARNCAIMLAEASQPGSAFDVDAQPGHAAIDSTAGRAHGLAGVLELLLSFAEDTEEEWALSAAAGRAAVLAEHARPLISLVSKRAPGVLSLAGSWCQGLTGIAYSLLHASDVLADPSFAGLAGQAGIACDAHLPRLIALGQCCGASGVGNLLIDLAVREQDQRYWDAANNVAVHMLMRSAGPPDHPMFVDSAFAGPSASWAFGLAGILTFFRRLSACGGDHRRLPPGGADPSAPAFLDRSHSSGKDLAQATAAERRVTSAHVR